jgi:hypothetical protein
VKNVKEAKIPSRHSAMKFSQICQSIELVYFKLELETAKPQRYISAAINPNAVEYPCKIR